MGLGVSLILIAAGAIMAWAVHVSTTGFNLHTVGYILLVVGIVAAIATNISYWNWYGFPSVYIASYMCIQIVGFLLVGVVAAVLLPKRVSTVSTIGAHIT